MSELAKSYIEVYRKMKENGSTWVQGRNGSYHCYNKAVVKSRMEELKSEILRLLTT